MLAVRNPPLDSPALLARLRALAPCDHYALAVSGGADSLALAALAAEITAVQFTVLSVDHGLRPEAAAEVQMVARLCQQWGMAHIGLCGTPPRDAQAAARRLRYDLMADWCRNNNVGALVLAHHMEDQAETFLLRLARGSGADGLAAMSPQTRRDALQLLRPFLDRRRAELAAVCAARGLSPVHDPSNSDPRFARARWRKALPKLARAGADVPMLAASAAQMARARARAQVARDAFIAAQCRWHHYGFVTVDRAALRGLPDAAARRVLDSLCRRIVPRAYPLRRRALDKCLAAIRDGESRDRRTLGGCLICLRQRYVLIGREAAAADSYVLPTKARSWDNRFTIAAHLPAEADRIAALGALGAQQLRDDGLCLPRAVPRAFIWALPALWRGAECLACPPLQPEYAARWTHIERRE